eukprot:TRINITY_DN1335_c0_g1_i1.p1 TRINITY_DN1335_c0_g1~~TRINITY_DN1335_c0_g1_i1.p1  ORF type:complete len:375 (+),score=72.90 TRINITY_DN1335_c0_g1_i1:117-1127(+)
MVNLFIAVIVETYGENMKKKDVEKTWAVAYWRALWMSRDKDRTGYISASDFVDTLLCSPYPIGWVKESKRKPLSRKPTRRHIEAYLEKLKFTQLQHTALPHDKQKVAKFLGKFSCLVHPKPESTRGDYLYKHRRSRKESTANKSLDLDVMDFDNSDPEEGLLRNRHRTIRDPIDPRKRKHHDGIASAALEDVEAYYVEYEDCVSAVCMMCMRDSWEHEVLPQDSVTLKDWYHMYYFPTLKILRKIKSLLMRNQELWRSDKKTGKANVKLVLELEQNYGITGNHYAQVKTAFDAMDADGNGRITFDELVGWFEQQYFGDIRRQQAKKKKVPTAWPLV